MPTCSAYYGQLLILSRMYGASHVVQSQVNEKVSDLSRPPVLTTQFHVFTACAPIFDRLASVPINLSPLPSLNLLLVRCGIESGGERRRCEGGDECHDDELIISATAYK